MYIVAISLMVNFVLDFGLTDSNIAFNSSIID